VPEVRVINHDGTQLGILPINEALQAAENETLDLVEVSPNANPPVCRIMDYGKYKYEQKKKANEARKSQHTTQLKEVKFRPNTSSHDFDFKLNNVKRFLKEGNKAKITITFRGRQIAYPQLGRDILGRIAEATKDEAVVEQHAKFEGRNMTMILAPQPHH
jgi:translation initiation factor IF-3